MSFRFRIQENPANYVLLDSAAFLATNPLGTYHQGWAGRGEPMLSRVVLVRLKRKLVSCGQCQELGQLADLASDWLFTLGQQISGASFLVDPTLDNDYNS